MIKCSVAPSTDRTAADIKNHLSTFKIKPLGQTDQLNLHSTNNDDDDDDDLTKSVSVSTSLPR